MGTFLGTFSAAVTSATSQPGAVYTTLDRLERKRLISSQLKAGTASRDGRARRYYVIENTGIRALNESRGAVNNIWHGLRWPLKGKT